MDIERQRRAELKCALEADFECFEETKLAHAIFVRLTVRADILAIPHDPRLHNFALAFEVKEPNQDWHYAKWSQAVRQASDYVFARITPDSSAAKYAGRRVSAAFLYPTPPYLPEGKGSCNSPYLRPLNEEIYAGVMHLALHFRVGYCRWNTMPRVPRLQLRFGPNPVWEQGSGFKDQGVNLLSGQRSIGSQRVDFVAELDGYASASAGQQNL